MSSSDPPAARRALAVLTAALLALSVLRCAAPDQCVRTSDCDDGAMCVSGLCRRPGDELDDPASKPDARTTADATTSEGGAKDGSAKSDASRTDASRASDAATTDQ